ncbi:regulator of chromosome condensation 1/beta-lactamase-inhibitor protein II [Gongronella butleri]|nr:regulator of chromosome condensation 1/beta-lactamase-inhibitor protein II [Gongronella butleri]
MTTLDSLPTDILVDSILGYLDVDSLIQLSYTNRAFYSLCQDEFLWKHLVLNDYSVPREATFRQMGWKTLYSKLNHSKVYVWGENNDGRLGLETRGNIGRRHFFNSLSVSSPQQLTALNLKKIVDIHAGGWSFHGLDKDGRVWVWGTIAAQQIWRAFGSERLREPTRIALPDHIRISSLSCGRSHAIALAKDGSVWHWNNYRVPERVHLPASLLESDSVVQVSANWGGSSILTKNGALIVIPLPDRVVPDEDEGSLRFLRSFPGDRQVNDAGYTDLFLQDADVSVVTLARLQQDARLTAATQLQPVLDGDVLVQIAGMEHHTMALSRAGRVYRFEAPEGNKISEAPASSTIEYIHYSAAAAKARSPGQSRRATGPSRFLTAAFHTFAVYTKDGLVLLGQHDDPFDKQPDTMDHQDICKVSFGDYHRGALTNDGRLLTWGGYSAGALGHGEQYEDGLDTPTEVDFFHDQYVFAIGFGGWHSAVLAIPK